MVENEKNAFTESVLSTEGYTRPSARSELELYDPLVDDAAPPPPTPPSVVWTFPNVSVAPAVGGIPLATRSGFTE